MNLRASFLLLPLSGRRPVAVGHLFQPSRGSLWPLPARATRPPRELPPDLPGMSLQTTAAAPGSGGIF